MIQAFSDKSDKTPRKILKIRTTDGGPDHTLNGEILELQYLLEIACIRMHGSYEGDAPWGKQVDFDHQYVLKECELNLVNPKILKYFNDMLSIYDICKVLKIDNYTSFGYDMSNEFNHE